jgi:hypothetical protein
VKRFWREFDFAIEVIRVFMRLTALATLIVYAR